MRNPLVDTPPQWPTATAGHHLTCQPNNSGKSDASYPAAHDRGCLWSLQRPQTSTMFKITVERADAAGNVLTT
jgi:hypothetical protein